MKRLLEVVDGKLLYGSDVPITDITNSSKDIKKGSVFFAIKGKTYDGHIFLEDVISFGASAVVIQDLEYASKLRGMGVSVIYSPDTRKSLAVASNRFFDNPSSHLKVVGATGTNGKTSVSNILQQFFRFAGYKTGLIGTINYRIDDEIISEGHTTPDPIEWFRTLKLMKDRGVTVVVAEVSSHGLDQSRVYSTRFDGAIFTNLTQDHLDYHKDMEDYFRAKEKLFYQTLEFNPKPKGSVSFDDIYGRRIYKNFKDRFLMTSFGVSSPDFKIEEIHLSLDETVFSYTTNTGREVISAPLLGEFNVYNLSAALSYLILDGFDERFLVEKSKELKPVRGRFEVVKRKGVTVVVDYAHTPDGLEKILNSLNKIKKNRIITVFGAGGNRDRSKRPLMGKVAESFSDLVVITSDNPRDEDPRDIMEDILSGVSDKSKVILEVDREKAIKLSIELAKEGDIVLIAGKGHETYQIVKGNKYQFDDRKVAEKYLKEE
ncbi:MAG: UDP-N-acetylmuramoyl-L-alanyl-D-glutamate--2,6-diaminopimelate ligase [Hydrogenothermaceae bacterium]|nr:UDP-N-acetylmuramoyl-L-alanyl-D-glutamate--2,6-diaminopimelate ligase [Hydrogenothermaceae bacterium]